MDQLLHEKMKLLKLKRLQRKKKKILNLMRATLQPRVRRRKMKLQRRTQWRYLDPEMLKKNRMLMKCLKIPMSTS